MVKGDQYREQGEARRHATSDERKGRMKSRAIRDKEGIVKRREVFRGKT